jgi:hypothetical protein
VFAFYDFDIEKKVVKYRQKATDEGTVYSPLASEATRAMALFKTDSAVKPPEALPPPADPRSGTN